MHITQYARVRITDHIGRPPMCVSSQIASILYSRPQVVAQPFDMLICQNSTLSAVKSNGFFLFFKVKSNGKK